MDSLEHCASMHHMMTIDVSQGLMLSLFLAGLIGGFTHCAGMCGPFVAAQSTARCDKKNESDSQITSWKSKEFFIRRLADGLLLPYHLGRVTTYVFLAVVVSGLANIAFLQTPYKDTMAAFFLTLAGFMFIVSAVPALGRFFPWLSHIRFPLLSAGLAKIARPFLIDSRGWRGYVLGLLLGFLPCGMVVAALTAVAASGGIAQAAMAMALFGLGTVPALFAVGLVSGSAGAFLPRLIRPLSRVVMAVNGVLLMTMAGNLVL